MLMPWSRSSPLGENRKWSCSFRNRKQGHREGSSLRSSSKLVSGHPWLGAGGPWGYCALFLEGLLSGVLLPLVGIWVCRSLSRSLQHLWAEEFKDDVACSPWGGNGAQPRGCAIVSWLFLPGLRITSFRWWATVWTCPLEHREGHGSRMKPVSYNREMGFCAQELRRVLLGFTGLSEVSLFERKQEQTQTKNN